MQYIVIITKSNYKEHEGYRVESRSVNKSGSQVMEVSFEKPNDNDMSKTNVNDSKMMEQSDEDNTDDEVC